MRFMVYMLWVITLLPSNNMQRDDVASQYVDKHRITLFYLDLTLSHLIKSVLSYNPWLFHGLWKPN